jgi:hypothetical protein
MLDILPTLCNQGLSAAAAQTACAALDCSDVIFTQMGCEVGAAIGGAIGSLGAGVGAVPGAIIGCFIGGAAANFAVNAANSTIQNYIQGNPPVPCAQLSDCGTVIMGVGNAVGNALGELSKAGGRRGSGGGRM